MNKNNTLTKKPKSKFGKFINKNSYVLLGFLCSAVLMMLVYYCFDIIPFGGRTVLRMDLYHQYGPLFAELYDRLTHFKSMFYSWNTGGGGAFLGNYFNYLSSPVGDLIALIAGHERIPEAIGVMVLVKNGLAASTLAYYLKKSTGKNDFTITAFGVAYSFCGFFIAYYWNIMWIDAMFLLPLVVLGIENIINNRKSRLYVAGLALTFFSNYYMAYMVCIFSVFYFLVYFISHCTFKDSYSTETNYQKTFKDSLKKLYNNKFLHSGVNFAVSSLIAVALVAFALIPTYFCLKECSATSGTFPSELHLYNNILDFLANHLASLEPTIRSSGDTVLPNVYCGILTILLVPIYIFCDKISAKERGAHIVLLALFFAGFNVNYVNYILHAFHFPNDLPFRFSFLYSFLLITMAFRALMHIKDISMKSILASGVGVMALAVIIQKTEMDNVTDKTIYVSIIFTAVYVIVLGLMRKKEYAQSTVALLLLCCVFAECAVANTDHFVITQEKVNFYNGYSEFRELKDKLDELEGNDDYRMELTDNNTIMDPCWFNYNGISVFSSMAYENVSNFQDDLGLDSNYINSYIYYSQTPVYNAMMSLKYLINNNNMRINPELYNEVTSNGKFTAYENKYYLPIAYAVSDKIADYDTSYSNPFVLQNEFWNYATGCERVLKKIPATSYSLENIQDSEDFLETNFTFEKEIAGETADITLTFDITKSQNVYLYVETSATESISVSTENGFNEDQSIEEAYILDCGYCRQGDVLTVDIPVDADEDIASVECYVGGLDMAMLKKGYKILSKNTMDVQQFEDTYIKGKINVDENQMIYTSINYDDGWTVLVDGKESKITKIGNALIGIETTPGEHTVEFRFRAKGALVGGIISGATAVLLIAYFVYLGIKKRKKNYSPQPEKNVVNNISDANPTGIDALMSEDMDGEITVEKAEALLNVPDEYELQKADTASTIQRADEILNTQKLDLNKIHEILQNGNPEEDK